MMTYDDFAKLDLRVGRVISAEKMENAEKLLKLIVKIGEEQRTLVAGIAKSYAPPELIGKNIIVLVNLEPRVLKGIESQGMLLAAETSSGHVLLTTDRDAPDGSKVG